MRTERVEFQLDCNPKVVKSFAPKLKALGIITVEPGDILKINYKLKIEYLGQVAEILETFVEMVAAGAIKTGDLVSDGEILIKRILESLQKLK